MKNDLNTPELILELHLEGRRSLLYRLKADDGSIMYYVESDLADHNRALGMENSVPLFYSLESAWRSIVGFIGQNSFSGRTVWHEKPQDWLLLRPTFIHSTVRPLIMRAISEATRNTEGMGPNYMDGLRNWIGQTSSSTPLRINYSHISNPTYHAHAKRA
jgi:hypothetical protein